MGNSVDERFTSLKLWKHFETAADREQVILVSKHIEHVLPLLNYFTTAFPTYTLHNGQHQRNILYLMGELLGPELSEVSALECAVLILSAFYHDLGMVFTEEELDSVESEPKFLMFLDQNTKARLSYESNGKKADRELIEWYCRTMHAERVWVYLDQEDIDLPLLWNDLPFKTQLGKVCESHNLSVKDIKNNDDVFVTDFLGECDLVFCSILLRLADIFDFDNTRSPKSVYEFLGLDKPKNNIESVSRAEWQKHLSSGGFTFQRNEDILTVLFKAAPKHPSVEIEIRNFLDIIEMELADCNELKRFCSKKWNEFKLPSSINRACILSTNFRSGKYHFSLSQDKILTLLTGEGLYNDRYIFLRELLQNSIDTSRHREFKEKISNSRFTADEIEISYFTDTDGYNWIRIDDYGMGMTEDIISNHLLKKGESYYNSDKFKLEKLLINQAFHNDFVPISRFGIGMLSCFIISDKIEISTKHISEPANAYRLTLEGQNGYFIFQSSKDHHTANPMPKENGFEKGFRKKAGTSIAVRITGNMEFHGFDFKKQIESYVLCSPIRIMYEGELVGGEWKALLEDPWTESHVVEVEKSFIDNIESTFDLKLPKSLQLEIAAVNVGEKSLDPNLKGQLVMIYLKIEEIISLKTLPTFSIAANGKELVIKVSKAVIKDGKSTDLSIEHRDIDIISSLNVPEKITNRLMYNNEYEYSFSKIQLSHNGITIHDQGDFFSLNTIFGREPILMHSYDRRTVYSGILYFQDRLLPSLTVSRNEIKDVTFELSFNALYALRDLNKFVYYDNDLYDFFSNRISIISSRRIIKESGIYENNKDYWDNEPLYLIGREKLSVVQIKELLKTSSDFFENPYFYRNDVINNFVLYILEQNFEVYISIKKMTVGHMTVYKLTIAESLIPNELRRFRPFRFFKFEEDRVELLIGDKININHRFVQWYIKASDLLSDKFNFYSYQLIHILYDPDTAKAVLNINSILDRLRKSLPQDIAPDKAINLNAKDFYL
ncbi:HD domain-containing protein [Flavobacterium hydatis]|uniref:ATP-binding protein n=1 Tax=Flavobacterium hydatis TaxID=991 RepID=A0A086A454_FLAHY|nr:ATP-binding protein [Flavobacterium hydatis]KFF11468.1 hypothetical protein IW20_19460 [Flavobacterium hydatis]OXA93668.1 ATP-binding protein [Flavobacterium hydatis]